MALTLLASDFSALGTWQLDYESTDGSLGYTCASDDPTAGLTLTIIQVDVTTGLPTGRQVSRDVSANLNKGRIVVFSGIPATQVPPFVRGQFYPFQFSGTWSP